MLEQEALNILGWKKEDLSTLQFIAYTYIKQGKYLVARTLLEALEVLNPKDLYTLQTLGAVYIENNQSTKALTALNKALSLDPTHEISQFNRVQALLTLGQKTEALSACQALLEAKNLSLRHKAEAILLSEKIS